MSSMIRGSDTFCTTFLHPCLFSTNLSSSSIASPVQVLSIHFIFGLPLALPPGMFLCISSFSRFFSCFLIIMSEICQFAHSYRLQELSFCFRLVQHPFICFLSLSMIDVVHILDQRFSTGGTRTTSGTPDVAKWYAKKLRNKYFINCII